MSLNGVQWASPDKITKDITVIDGTRKEIEVEMGVSKKAFSR